MSLSLLWRVVKMFHISQTKIDPTSLGKRFDDPKAGAVVTFEGRVRNHNEGKSVKSLEYQAYGAMAVKEGQKILKSALEKFDILDAYCVHAEGHLEIGDVAIWIIVTSKHRAEAYKANQFIIDTVKATVPIWKKEHYLDEEPVWVACHQCAGSDQHEHSL